MPVQRQQFERASVWKCKTIKRNEIYSEHIKLLSGVVCIPRDFNATIHVRPADGVTYVSLSQFNGWLEGVGRSAWIGDVMYVAATGKLYTSKATPSAI